MSKREPEDGGGSKPPSEIDTADTLAALPDAPTLASEGGAGQALGGPVSVAVADTVAETSTADEERPRLASGVYEGDRLDHFVVLDKLGEGGMGVVLAAYDPDLDRKVAIKLLRADAWGETAATKGRKRLLREAQAMAKLSHPNVVVVHEVGVVDGRVFVAMEYVDGCTLAQWARERDRGWREIVEMFSRAGRGLAAAHEAGLVHRDFKPDNVLVGDDDRVRVTDFGIVGTRGATVKVVDADGGETTLRDDQTPLSVTLTREGTLLGTPMYMAPEQHERRAADERADQFSFCLALYEALYGMRPFAGTTSGAVLRRMRRGEVEPPGDGRSVPGWVRAILLRGLSFDPEERFPSMEALLEELGNDPTAARRRRLRIAMIATGFTALAGIAVFGLLRGPAGGPVCEDSAGALRGVWDAGVKAQVKIAFQSSGQARGPETFARVAVLLDDYAAAWAAMRQEACEATHLRGEQSDTMLELRMACLDRRLGELGALTENFVGATDAEVVDRAVFAVSSLPGLARCTDRDALWNAVPLPEEEETRRQVLEVEGAIDRAVALYRIGKFRIGIDLAAAQIVRADALGHLPTRARALWCAGNLQRGAGNLAEAESTLRKAVQVAAQAKDDALVAEVWLNLLAVLTEQGRQEEALVLRATVDAAVARAGNDVAQRAVLLGHLGALRRHEGELDRAEAALLEAVSLRRKAGEGHVEVGAAQVDLADLLLERGKHAEAAEQYRAALANWEASLGPAHPMTARAAAGLERALRGSEPAED